jgi:UDP-N-acetylglucosamine enolpyruvyl transferase
VLEVEEDMKEEMLKSIRKPLESAGVKITEARSRWGQFKGIEISLVDGVIKPVDIKTGPYPDFPTDLLPQWVAFMTQAATSETKKYSTVHDQIFESRFNYVDGLKAMGAKIKKVNEREYRVYGGILALYHRNVELLNLFKKQMCLKFANILIITVYNRSKAGGMSC